MSEEAEVKQSIVLGRKVDIDLSDPDVYRIGDCELPKAVIFFSGSREIRFREGWRIGTQLEVPKGKTGLHYPIVSIDPNEQRKFFIPADIVASLTLK